MSGREELVKPMVAESLEFELDYEHRKEEDSYGSDGCGTQLTAADDIDFDLWRSSNFLHRATILATFQQTFLFGDLHSRRAWKSETIHQS